MQLDAEKYRGCELSEVPTEYLEWASIHLPLSSRMGDVVIVDPDPPAKARPFIWAAVGLLAAGLFLRTITKPRC